MGSLGAGAPGLTSVAPPSFESALAGPLGTHARSRTGAGPGNTGGNGPPAGHMTSGQGPAVSRAVALGGRARLVGVARAGAARRAKTWCWGIGARYATGCGIRSRTPLWRH